MQVKTTQKISRSAVATVLATSSVALGLPAQTNAAEFFKDVKPADFFYTAVNELAEKKVVSGYGDGTFRPFNNVTRGEAAKMLALSLKLDVSKAETTQFSDVKKGDLFYKYIAALANKGIINGYPDGKFKPNEVVQRGAMAKMVALGYEFALARNITHPFKDVEKKNIFNQHIQTLVNLNITKGTSFNTFEPGKAVTRGELAAFISRANKANAGKPLYVVDNIIGNKIYINSVGYTISSNVAAYIKAENKSALIGAHIEGTFTGMTLTNVSRLTLNAVGNANSVYTFDGGNATYNGTLVVNGSYLKFKNWTLNGQTIVSETPRKSLAQYNRLSEIKIASLASGIIDFTRPTNPDDGNLNNGSNDGSLNTGTGTSPNAPYSEKLSPIHKYIDFTNVTVRNLFVEQNRAYIAAQKEIVTVTVRRNVEFAELNFNMRNLYIEGDESLTLYGTHDIETVYKNSYYSLYFNTNSEIGTLIVDNSNGWIDLGDFVFIENVIIPPKTTPNDIFDDYKNDNDKIGNIQDNTGKEVDRNPIENGIVPDVTKPIVHSLTVEADSNLATASLTVNETGKYHYLVLPENSPAPTVREIVSAQSGLSGSGAVTESEMTPDGRYTTTFIVRGLDTVTKYTMYVVHVDDAGNFSARQERDFETKDGTPPQFMTASAQGLTGGRRIQFDFKPSERGTYYYFLRETQNVDNTITVDDVINGADFSGIVTDADVEKGVSHIIRQFGKEQVKPLTNYVIYAALVDESGNKILNVKAVQTRTPELDETPPFVTGPTDGQLQQLEPLKTSGGLSQFYMYFNEKLSKETAENIENYSLSGTGIINVPGQQPIKPSKVEYFEHGTGSRVLISIPSLTGFVHGDTLRVIVSKEVLDMAENEFENISNAPSGVTPRNYAEYQHSDPYFPNLKITKVERDITSPKSKIYYDASKAGQIYYMIIPESIDFAALGIKPEDFVAEFGSDPTTKFNDLSLGGKIYLEGNTPSALKAPITAEIGEANFDYDYSNLNLNSFESYKVYMVLKDRSGRLSGIMSETIIADTEPPKIISYDLKSVLNNDTKARVSVTSENEGGTVYIGYAPKYTFNTTKSKYELNPTIFDGTLPREFGVNSQYTNAEKKKEFLQKVPNTITRTMLKGALNEYEISGLQPNTEYVFYYAVEDTFGNFTVKNSTNTTMRKELYADGTLPYVINNTVVKDPFGNFHFTFNESIGREYVDTNIEKTTLNQTSHITTGTSVASILTIIPENPGSTLAASDFEVVSYTEGTSTLVIKPKPGVTILESFKVNLLLPDQNINENTKNKAIAELIHYKYPTVTDQNIFRSARLIGDNYTQNDGISNRSTKAEIEVVLNVDTNWNQNYYYAVVSENSALPTPDGLSPAIVKAIVDNANADSGLEVNGLISYGKGKITGSSDLSSVKTIEALQYNNNSSTSLNVFFTNQRLYLFTLDKYGNIIWTKGTNNDFYVSIQDKISRTTP